MAATLQPKASLTKACPNGVTLNGSPVPANLPVGYTPANDGNIYGVAAINGAAGAGVYRLDSAACALVHLFTTAKTGLMRVWRMGPQNFLVESTVGDAGWLDSAGRFTIFEPGFEARRCHKAAVDWAAPTPTAAVMCSDINGVNHVVVYRGANRTRPYSSANGFGKTNMAVAEVKGDRILVLDSDQAMLQYHRAWLVNIGEGSVTQVVAPENFPVPTFLGTSALMPTGDVVLAATPSGTANFGLYRSKAGIPKPVMS